MIALERARSLVLGRRGTGLLHEPHKTPRDRVWMGEVGDVSNVKLAAAEVKLAEPHVTLEPHAPPIGDQQSASWCVGEMCMALVAITESVYRLPYEPISPLAAYRQSVAAHTPKGEPLKDEGTYIRVALSQLAKLGCPTLARVPRRWKRGEADLAGIPAIAKSEGFNRRGLRYEFIVPFSLFEEMELVDAAIALKQPVGFGWSVTERYMAHRGTAPYDARLKRSDVVRGGHAQVQVSQRDEQGVVRFRNSWGTGWGDRGYVNVIAETVARRDIVLVDGWERISGRKAV